MRNFSGDSVPGKCLPEKRLRKELAAFDLGYFGRAYLSHYFTRPSPEFHEELDEIWETSVMKSQNPMKCAKEISRMKGSRNAIAAPRGHAKSTNLTFKDDLHAALYGYKHYILILSDSSDQAEGFLDEIKTELEENADIIEDFGALKSDKAWRSNVIVTKNDVKIEAIGSGKKVRGRKHRNWRPDLIVLDDVENDENVNTPEQRKKLKSWFEKAVSKVDGVQSCAVSLLTNSMGVEGNADPNAVIKAVENAGYSAKLQSETTTEKADTASVSAEEEVLQDHETPKLKKRLWYSLGYLVILMYITMGYGMLGLPLPAFLNHNHIGLGLTQMFLTLILMIINKKFFISGFKSFMHGSPNMDSLIAIGSSAAIIYGIYAIYKIGIGFGHGDMETVHSFMMDLYFESAGMISDTDHIRKDAGGTCKGKKHQTQLQS